MFLHIGNGKSVRKKDVIGIFDLDTATITKTGKDFINRMQREGRVEYEDDDLPRSFLLIEENKKYKVNLSRISSRGLAARADESGNDKEN